MRQLVQDIRSIVAEGSVDEEAIGRLEAVVKSAIPRLQNCSICKDPPKPGRYLCYKDADYNFVIMVLSWGQGDGTPIHDHGTWGVEAVIKDSLLVTNYNECEVNPAPLSAKVYEVGAVMHNLPPDRDVHKVQHHEGERALSLHVYGREMTGNRMFVPGQGFKVCRLECCMLETEFDLSGLQDLSKARNF